MALRALPALAGAAADQLPLELGLAVMLIRFLSSRRNHVGKQSARLGCMLSPVMFGRASSVSPAVEMMPIAAPLALRIGEPDMPPSILAPLTVSNLPPLYAVHGTQVRSSSGNQQAEGNQELETRDRAKWGCRIRTH